MKDLLRAWPQEFKRHRSGRFCFFFDYDGTLAPIAALPARAVLPDQTKILLAQLAADERCRVAVVSGRALSDLKKRVGLGRIVYGGNHGLEIEGPSIRHTAFTHPRHVRALAMVKQRLARRLAAVQGAALEDKGLSLSVHYRLAKKKDVSLVETIFREETILPSVKNQIRTHKGKKVFEVRPPVAWDKGAIVLWLLARWRFQQEGVPLRAVYIGDDRTDEDAFRALRRIGITASVGVRADTAAQYYLKAQSDVARFIGLTLTLMRESSDGA